MDGTPLTTQVITAGTGSKDNECVALQNDGTILGDKCSDDRPCFCENSGIGKAGGEYNGEYN